METIEERMAITEQSVARMQAEIDAITSLLATTAVHIMRFTLNVSDSLLAKQAKRPRMMNDAQVLEKALDDMHQLADSALAQHGTAARPLSLLIRALREMRPGKMHETPV